MYLAPLWRSWGGGVPPLHDLQPASFAGAFVRWDAGYYAAIATGGYSPDGNERAFYPLYPTLVAILTALTGLSIYGAGLLISLAGYLLAAWALYDWSERQAGSTVARGAVLWLAFFPMSFFLVAFYPESLFLAASLWALLLLERGRFVASGIVICLAGLARPHGFLLAVPYLVEAWQQRHDLRVRLWHVLLGAAIAPLGAVTHLLRLESRGGQGIITTTYFAVLARGWNTYLTYPWRTFIDGARGTVLGEGINQDWFSRLTTAHDFLYVLVGIVLAIWALRHLRLSAGLYLLAGVLLFLLTHGPEGYAFESYPRHLASLAPVYPALALLTAQWPPALRVAVLTASGVQLLVLTAWFASGGWVA